MTRVFIDQQEIELATGVTLLEALLSAGVDLPYFCWHPSLGSVGACRQCAVLQYRDEQDDRGRIVMSCMTQVAEGARFGVLAPAARTFRESVVENLMLNHPHDCPVCEEGGECHLQDMTVMVGHRDRRYQGLKRTFRNQYLGPLVGHEMNRCITCYRCVRFYQDYAGGDDLGAFASRDHIYFGRSEPGVLESEFAGNLVEVCPTGVFTDKTLSGRYTRKWDLQSAPSICTACSLGCNVTPSERSGELRRIQNRYNQRINGYFLCDRGRYGAGYVNVSQRIPAAGVRNGGVFDAVPADQLLDQVAQFIREAPRVIGIGSVRASVEANYVLQRLVGAENFHSGLGQRAEQVNNLIVDILSTTAASLLSLQETESCDAVLILGEDTTNHGPRLALSLRQAARNASFDLAAAAQIPLWHDAAVRKIGQQAHSPIIIATPYADRLDDIATLSLRMTPLDIAQFGFAVAEALRTGHADDVQVGRVMGILQQAERPLIVSGSSLANAEILKAAANVANALAARNSNTGIVLCADACNAVGMGLLPHQVGGLESLISKGAIDTAIVLENDLSRALPPDEFRQLVANIRHLIVIDHHDNPTASASTHVLPAATFAETEGTVVNNEATAQRHFAVYKPAHPVAPAWQWLARLGQIAGKAEFARLVHIDDVIGACERDLPQFKGIAAAAPDAGFRHRGARVPRMTHRASGRTALVADTHIHEPQQPIDRESPLAFSMEGSLIDVPAALRPYVWAPGWNSNQAVGKFQAEIGGSQKGGDPGQRLIPRAAAPPPFYTPALIPTALLPIVPRHYIFGSEELSAMAPAIRELTPAAGCVIHPNVAMDLGVSSGDGLQYQLGSESFTLEVWVDAGVADGCVVVPYGLPATRQLMTVPALAFVRADPWERKSDPDLITSDRER